MSNLEYVYICYKISDDNTCDIRTQAVCTSEEMCVQFLKEYDCYRKVPLNTKLPDLKLADLHYKTEDGFTVIDD